MTTRTWNGNAMSQDDMMIKDTVIVLNENDEILGSASKKESHVFSTETPRGILHRAFSVFLFDESTGDLLLQQRASTKITFPYVRTYYTVLYCVVLCCVVLCCYCSSFMRRFNLSLRL